MREGRKKTQLITTRAFNSGENGRDEKNVGDVVKDSSDYHFLLLEGFKVVCILGE